MSPLSFPSLPSLYLSIAATEGLGRRLVAILLHQLTTGLAATYTKLHPLLLSSPMYNCTASDTILRLETLLENPDIPVIPVLKLSLAAREKAN